MILSRSFTEAIRAELTLYYLYNETGLGALGISIEGAHRSDLEMKSNSPTEYTLQYKPHEPGIYLLNIKFGDDHVSGKC